MISLPGYKITDEIYQSKRSLVYRGVRLRDDIRVLIKVLKTKYPTERELGKLKREFEIAGELKIPGVVKHYALEPHKNGMALITEDFDAVSLEEFRKENLSLKESLEILIQLVEALGEIHKRHVIHKDIKPQNIVINPANREVKFIDFGISSRLSREVQSISSPGKLEGTLAYMSPEQTGRMNRAVDYRSDYYSLGITIYELLTGKPPFVSQDPMELVHSHIARTPERPETLADGAPLPQIIADIILKLISKTPEERYRGAYGLKQDLEQCLERLGDDGRIGEFALASRDISDTFQIPQKLFGREREVETLMDTFFKVSAGAKELLLVSGASGVGKSALINEIHKPIVERRGYFLSGKFDQFKRDIPYSALIQAFQELIRQLLTENKDKIAEWKDKLVSAFGPNGQVIIDVIPEIEHIVGEQSPIPELSPTETQNRFNLVFRNFIRAFAHEDHPLTIFLDDLQWADSATLHMLHSLLQDPEMGYLFLIGAYRDKEVNEVHPLTLVLEEIRKIGIQVKKVGLTPLKLKDVYRLLEETLNLEAQPDKKIDTWVSQAADSATRKAHKQSGPVLSGGTEASGGGNVIQRMKVLNLAGQDQVALPPAAEFAELVFKKTDGNPFFVNEFLKSLYNDSLLNFDLETGDWRWDIHRIRAVGITDDVVEFMADSVRKLDKLTQDTLKIASCLGNAFDLRMLSIVAEKSFFESAGLLEQALREGLILPLNDSYKYVSKTTESGDAANVRYRFLHDRLHQATYSLLGGEERAALHLKIGRLYLENLSMDEREERLLDLISHLNRGRDLILDQKERIRLAELNLAGGRKSKLSTAYESAIQLFGVAMDIMPRNAKDVHYELFMNLNMELGETHYVNNNFKAADKYFNTILKIARTPLEKLKVYKLKIVISTGQSKPDEAVRIGLEALGILGLKLPENPSPSYLRTELIRTRRKLGRKTPARILKMPRMKDPTRLATMQLLAEMGMPAYLLSSSLFPVLTARMVRLSLKYGNSPQSAYAYAAYGMLLSSELKDFEGGDSFGKLAMDMVEKFRAAELKCRVYYLYATSISHWKHHAGEKYKYLMQAYSAGLETGDLQYVSFCIYQMNCSPLWTGARDLKTAGLEMEKYHNALFTTGQKFSLYLNNISRQYILNMQGGSRNKARLVGEKFDENERIESWTQAGNANGLYFIYFNKMILACLFGRADEALQFAEKARENTKAVLGSITIPILYFYHSVALLSKLRDEKSKRRAKKIIDQVEVNQNELLIWSDHCPENFLFMYELVEAEKAGIQARHGEALKYYDQAIRHASQGGFTLLEGYANELAGRYYLANEKPRFAIIYLKEARRAYRQNRATAKVSILERRFQSLLAGQLSAELTAPTPIEVTAGSDVSVSRGEVTETRNGESMNPLTVSMADSTIGSSTIGNTTVGDTFSGMTANPTTTAAHTSNLDMETVIKASQALSGEIDLSKLLEKMVDIVMENAGAQKVILLLPEDGKLLIEAQKSLGNEEARIMESIPAEESHDLPLSIVNYVERTKSNVVLNNAAGEGHYREDPYIVENHTRSALSMPIMSQGKLAGIFYMENDSATGVFTRGRLEILKILSSQIATSLENARLYENLKLALEEEQKAKQAQIEINKAIQRFVPMEFLQILGQENIVNINLGENIQKTMTVLFSDIRAFTTLSESMTPEQNFRFINSYLGRMGPVVRNHSGFIDKYIGDAIMALFPNADDAISSAIEMFRELEEYNTGRQKAGYIPIKIGIGINTGDLMLGTIGEESRMEGTVISDAVNLAARLEGLTKAYGASLIVSGSTLFDVEDPTIYTTRILDRVLVKGKKAPVTLIEILDGEPPETRELKQKTKADFERAVTSYTCREFEEALASFENILAELPTDKATYLYIQRCRRNIELGVPEDWDGIEKFETK